MSGGLTEGSSGFEELVEVLHDDLRMSAIADKIKQRIDLQLDQAPTAGVSVFVSNQAPSVNFDELEHIDEGWFESTDCQIADWHQYVEIVPAQTPPMVPTPGDTSEHTSDSLRPHARVVLRCTRDLRAQADQELCAFGEYVAHLLKDLGEQHTPTAVDANTAEQITSEMFNPKTKSGMLVSRQELYLLNVGPRLRTGQESHSATGLRSSDARQMIERREQSKVRDSPTGDSPADFPIGDTDLPPPIGERRHNSDDHSEPEPPAVLDYGIEIFIRNPNETRTYRMVRHPRDQERQ
ncbi:hypothetical protein GNI_075890 [Gregarina niphandrodes]|uniref:Uncharacterized protein n=1 Tax=Gregarina niphandrodes TaxID=110365 RepID=A0A023B6U6_GRENI|nr:hypothetical protein GNI_075890 [Gregarina niphandrodes]EZG66776.1 hypothetical protein GNI_075890 [Gregarina niphandrodes]|eukprot:XP_011130487.1 hypothetical protein GNI_075890 [Gregarina niphandrodes]